MSSAKIIDATDAADTAFLDAVRTRINARSLVTPPATVELEHEQLTRLFQLAEEGLNRRKQRREEPPQPQGPVGHVAGSGIDRETWFVRIEFHDRATAQRAATLLFADVRLEPIKAPGGA